MPCNEATEVNLMMGKINTPLLLAPLLLIFGLAGCSISPTTTDDSAPVNPVDISSVPDATPRAEPRSRYGNPASYVVNGQRYHVMQSSQGYVERGIASWYGTKFHGRRTSSGETYNMYAMTAAHKSLPLPTYAQVTNLKNGRSIVVKINDRGPFHDNRIIDLSYAAAAKLGILKQGTGLVEVRAIGPGQELTPAPATAMKMAQKSGDLFIQVGAFSSRYNADRLAEQLANSLSREIRIRQTANGTSAVFRVQVGPLVSIAQADDLTLQLTQLGIQDIRVIID
jgi:rare lipoprotein A